MLLATTGTLRFSQAKNGFLAYGVWVLHRRGESAANPLAWVEIDQGDPTVAL